MSVQYGVSYDNEKCIQCHGCEVACKSWRGLELGVRWRRVNNIWDGRYPNIKSTSVSVACMQCAEPVCVEACPEAALKKRDEDGVVVVDRNKCEGCETCLEECPFGAPQYGADGKMQKCDLCMNDIDFTTEVPPCVETCPTKALVFVKMTKQEKTATEQSVKKLLGM